jgi:hypothetical protein
MLPGALSGPPDLHQAVGRARDASLHNQNIPVGVDTDYFKAFYGYSSVTHVASHLEALEHLAWGGAAPDGSGGAGPV